MTKTKWHFNQNKPMTKIKPQFAVKQTLKLTSTTYHKGLGSFWRSFKNTNNSFTIMFFYFSRL